MNEKSFELFSAFVEGGFAMVVVAAVVENLSHVLNEVSEAAVVVAHDLRFDLFEIFFSERN